MSEKEAKSQSQKLAKVTKSLDATIEALKEMYEEKPQNPVSSVLTVLELAKYDLNKLK